MEGDLGCGVGLGVGEADDGEGDGFDVEEVGEAGGDLDGEVWGVGEVGEGDGDVHEFSRTWERGGVWRVVLSMRTVVLHGKRTNGTTYAGNHVGGLWASSRR